MEQDVNAITVVNPITGNTDKLSVVLSDRAEMQILHMIPFVADRVPTFTMFGNDTYFDDTFFSAVNGVQVTEPCVPGSSCLFLDSGFAWNHGDFRNQITRTWFGMVGPGVTKKGRTDNVFSDHTICVPP